MLDAETEREREGGREGDRYLHIFELFFGDYNVDNQITFGNQTWLGGNQPFSLLIFPAFSERGFPSQIIQDYPSLSNSVG